MNFLKSKYIYMLFLVVVCLSMMVIVPTYAKFGSSYATSDVATFSVLFDVSLEDMEEYEELVVEAGSKYKFNVNITNDTDRDIYYGIWYRMVSPSALNNDISIGRLSGTLTTTSGLINSGDDTTVTVVVVNNSKSDVIIDLGVASSYDGVDDISYVNGKYLISKDVLIPTDISITSVVIDGVNSDTLPVSGLYDMKYTCNKGTNLKWDKFSKVLTYSSGSYVMDECSLEFNSSDDLPLLNEMKVGSYVSYVGESGMVGDSNVSCSGDLNINSCSGMNANEELEQANSNTYGYCYSSDYRYYTTGFKIAYIDNENVVLISAGAPECLNRKESINNLNYIKVSNTRALAYCNSDFVDGNCSCEDIDKDGLCDSASSDAWAIGDRDFYYITKAISGYGKRLTSFSSSLGELGESGSVSCYLENTSIYSSYECGYNSDILDNGGVYWFSANHMEGSSNGVFWNPLYRSVQVGDITGEYGLRPMIKLSASVKVTGGNGTMDDPYTITK